MCSERKCYENSIQTWPVIVFFLSSSNNVVYMKCEIRWAFVHGSQTSAFSATVEVQKNKKPLSHNTLCSSGKRWGFSTSQHSRHQEKSCLLPGLCHTVFAFAVAPFRPGSATGYTQRRLQKSATEGQIWSSVCKQAPRE